MGVGTSVGVVIGTTQRETLTKYKTGRLEGKPYKWESLTIKLGGWRASHTSYMGFRVFSILVVSIAGLHIVI